MSGAGKSTLARQWIKEMLELNKSQQFDVLSFQFEMLGIDEVARDLSSKLNKSIKKIYSADGTLTEKEMSQIELQLEELKKYPLFIVDNIGTVDDIKDTIVYYATTNHLADRKRGLVVSIDHSLLIKSRDHEDEKTTLDRLMHTLVALKKYLVGIGVNVIFIVLSQLNRNIESTERILNKKLHYPNKNDLFGASSVYYSSDYVIIIHRPYLIEGLGLWYGPDQVGFPHGLPVFNPLNSQQPMIYLHIIKERFGNTKVLAMVDELAFGRIAEYNG